MARDTCITVVAYSDRRRPNVTHENARERTARVVGVGSAQTSCAAQHTSCAA